MLVENSYEVIKELGSSLSTKSTLVEHKYLWETLVVKRIECVDEHQANEFFDQFVALREFKNDQLIKIKDIFIKWDQNIRSFFLCLVKEYTQMPSLEEIIKIHLETNPISFELIDLILCQSLNILNDFKERGLVHRAIHPGNIFTDTKSVRISDALTESMCNYSSIKHRKNIDDKYKWLPPEAKECRHMVDKSDCWSLGCVMVNLIICGFIKEDKMEEIMISVRSNGEIPADLIKRIQRIYPRPLIELVKRMIILDHDKRIGITEALQEKCLQRLMDEYDAKRRLKRKRREKELHEFDIPFDKGLGEVLRYLGDQIEHENCVEGVLAWIAQTQCQNGAPTNPFLPLLIWKVFLVHNENPAIYQHGLEILIHCTSVGEMQIQAPVPAAPIAENPTPQVLCDAIINNSIYWNKNTLNLISDLARRHSEHLQIHERVLTLLEAIFCPMEVNNLTKDAQLAYWSEYSPLYRGVCKMIYPELIIRGLLKVHDGSPDILRIALAVMWKLCIDEENAKIFIEMGAFKPVYDIMYFWPRHPQIINQGALCLAALSSSKWLTEDTLMEYDLPTLLMQSIESFCLYTEVCYNLFYAIGSIVNRSAEQMLRFIRPKTMDKVQNLIALILKVYASHHDNNRIIGILVQLLGVIMANDAILEAIFSVIPTLKALLTEIYNRFHSCRDLGAAAKQILDRIPEAYDISTDAIEPQILNEFKMLSI